eukprot:1161717-Pelagomonas_calceolata.AAC.13
MAAQLLALTWEWKGMPCTCQHNFCHRQHHPIHHRCFRNCTSSGTEKVTWRAKKGTFQPKHLMDCWSFLQPTPLGKRTGNHFQFTNLAHRKSRQGVYEDKQSPAEVDRVQIARGQAAYKQVPPRLKNKTRRRKATEFMPSSSRLSAVDFHILLFWTKNNMHK